MSSTWMWILAAAILCLTQESSCTESKCSNGVATTGYEECTNLPALSASLAWTLDKFTNSIHFAFTEDMPDESGWVAWGINPDSDQMVGTQALAAFRNSSGIVTVKTYDVTAAVKSRGILLLPGAVRVAYSNISAVLVTTTVTISGMLSLATAQTSFLLNHVWNRGPGVETPTSALLGHPLRNENLISSVQIDMDTGHSISQGQIPNKRLKHIHGVINAIAWGILLPIGAILARYLRTFESADPAWLRLHMVCQILGYNAGTAGWVLGLRLQNSANPIKYKHRNIGIAIWALATFQILAAVMMIRMRKTQRWPFWNVVHPTVGYTIIILSNVNIFEGIVLLDENKWKRVYIVILAILALIAIVLELVTWLVWFLKSLRRRKHRGF